jgi:tRNA modification GTPase
MGNIIETIVALSTPSGMGAIGIVRMSGEKSFEILDLIFKSKAKNADYGPNRNYFGEIMIDDQVLDDVVVSFYKAPKTYTGEDLVEICCHGSNYIIDRLINECIKNGARLASGGEFTQRAFMNGKMDLSQAESVADLIASENKAQHEISMHQMRGGFSKELVKMRLALIEFAALLELELDFSEEDVEFVNRDALLMLLKNILKKTNELKNSFTYGNAIKKGVPIAIVGKPNSGKSTLLNTLLNEDKAIVSKIAGTTRDSIEDVLYIDQTLFRVIDTAGLRKTDDEIEQFGIEKTMQKIKEATILLYMVAMEDGIEEMLSQIKQVNLEGHQQMIIVVNKIDEGSVCDAYDVEEALSTKMKMPAIAISAKQKMHIDGLTKLIGKTFKENNMPNSNVIISNMRHYEALEKISTTIEKVIEDMGLHVSSEFLAIDVRYALQQIGNITGEIELDRDILGTIFGKFCIGK